MRSDQLTAKKFDDVIEGSRSKPPLIWGAKAIGQKIGRSPQYVRRTLALADGSPVRRDSAGQLYAVERELMDFFGAMSR